MTGMAAERRIGRALHISNAWSPGILALNSPHRNQKKPRKRIVPDDRASGLQRGSVSCLIVAHVLKCSSCAGGVLFPFVICDADCGWGAKEKGTAAVRVAAVPWNCRVVSCGYRARRRRSQPTSTVPRLPSRTAPGAGMTGTPVAWISKSLNCPWSSRRICR